MAVVFLYRNYNTEGKQVYAYLSVRMDKVGKLRKAMMRDGVSFNLNDYGVVLACGYGDPTPEVMLDMQEKYGLKPGNYLDMDAYFSEEFDKKIEEYNALVVSEDDD